MSVLCFSPNDRTLEALVEILADAGIRARGLTSADDALEALEKDRFDLIIADDDFVARDGEDFLDEALSRALLRGNAFLITAREPEPIGRAWKVLRAPIDAVRLVEQVRAVLHGAEAPSHAADLRLYVGESESSASALRTLQRVLSRVDPSRFLFTVIDVSTSAGVQEAQIDHVHYTPTLVMRSPARAWVIGALDDPRAIQGLLELAGLRAKPATDERVTA